MVDHPTMEVPYWRPPYGLDIALPRIDLPTIGGVQVTRFMVTELIAAALMLLILPADRPADGA